ncbi:MAG: hypothetical protein ABRQ38_00140 [Candidatus Eremiobacterota bacterium]
MKLPENFKITGSVDEIYWHLKDTTDIFVTEGKKPWVFGCLGAILFISLFTLIPIIFISSPSEDASYRGWVYFLVSILAVFMIIIAAAKHKAGFAKKKEALDMMVGIIEAVRDDLRNKGLMTLTCEFAPGKKPVESDQKASEPRFSSVRRIKYKYKTADFRFTMLDGNILKVRIYTKEREKIKVDHRTKRYFRKKFLLKIRLDINHKCYDMARFNDGVYNNYQLTPNIVISKVSKGENHISIKALLSKLDQYSGRQVAGMIKGIYAGIKLKKFSQVATQAGHY